MRFKKRTLALVGCLLMAVAIGLGSLSCGGGYSQAERDYVEQELKNLGGLNLDVDLMIPIGNTIGDLYEEGNFQNTTELMKEIDKEQKSYEEITSNLGRLPESDVLIPPWEEMRNLRTFLFLRANYTKIMLEIIKKDIQVGVNSSLDILQEMNNLVINDYNFAFNDEYRKIARKYNIPETE